MPTTAPDSIGFLVVDLARLFRRDFERLVAEEGFDLTAGEARTLLHASLCDGVRQNVLAERMRVEAMTLVNFLDRLEARGLVRRYPDPDDRRAKLVAVTDAGKPLVLRIRALAAKVREQAAGDLSAGDVEAFRRTLQTMRRNLSDGADGGRT